MRQRWIYPSDGREPFEVATDYAAPTGILLMPDLPGYMSQSGIWVEGRAARREDLKRQQARPWEGIEQERKEAQRKENYQEQRREANLDRAAHEALYQLPPSKRDILKRIG